MENQQLFLYYPVKNPINPTNLFGANPAEYKPLGQNGHPGNDFEAPSYTPVYAPCDGDAFYTYDSLGGDGLWIRFPSNAAPTHNIILWHMPQKDTKVTLADGSTDDAFKIPCDNWAITHVTAGQLLGYSDNSGFPKESTGPHLHLGVQPCNSTGAALSPNNGFLGCVDPQPFYNGKYAEDIQTEKKILDVASEAVSDIASDTSTPTPVKVTLLQEIAQLLEKYL